jgi:purine-binding chemotaxis protein CheW
VDEELLLFRIEKYHCAVRIADAPYCFRAVAVVPLPAPSSFFSGYINFHGSMIPVYDIRKRFILTPAPLTPDNFMLRLTVKDRSFIIIVDEIISFIHLDQGSIAPVPSYETSNLPITGVFQTDGEPVYILDPDSLFAHDEVTDFSHLLATLPSQVRKL